MRLLPNRSEITLGESMELLLEMVSAGRVPAMLVKVTDLAPAGVKSETMGEKYRVVDGSVELNGHRLEPFETLDLRLRITPTAPGDFELRPRALYLDQDGRYSECLPAPIALKTRGGMSSKAVSPLPELEASASKVFDYLVKAFVEDYMRRKLQFEQAGWRSIPQLAKETRLSRSSLYGTAARYGRPISDLLTGGLIESRITTGHRGRGGDAVKLRIAYDKEPVKRHVDRVAVGSK
jgi:hypothetical protein